MDVCYLRIFLILFLLDNSSSDEACEFVNDDYCFRFGQMSCYQKICQCEVENCTGLSECILSPWCDPSGETLPTHEDFAPGDFHCDKLKIDCLTRPKSNGYCYIYRQKCDKDEDVEAKLESSLYGDLSKNCPRWKRKCAERGPTHTSCVQFSNKCGWLNMTTENDLSRGSSTSSEENRSDLQEKQKMEKMCTRWERKCAEKWPDHYSCRMLKKKCRTQNPVIQPITGLKPEYASDVTESVAVQDREKLVDQCHSWKKTCARKYPRHFSCRQYRRKCKFVDLYPKEFSTIPIARGSLVSVQEPANFTATELFSNIEPDEASGLLSIGDL